MPLHYDTVLPNGPKIFVWKLKETLEDLKSVVSINEVDKRELEAILLPVKKREYLAGKYTLKKACEFFGIKYNGVKKDEHGKPHLVESSFEISLTHTSEYIGVAIMENHPVGIDLERPRKQIFKILPRLYSEEEIALINNDLRLATVFWSAKEALYKLYGRRGLDFRENLFVLKHREGFYGKVSINEHKSSHSLFITSIEDHILVVAY